MEWWAARAPNRLVMPRSSSFTEGPPLSPTSWLTPWRDMPRGAPAVRRCSPCGTNSSASEPLSRRLTSLRLARRGDLDLPRDDVRLGLRELALQRGRDLAVPVVERREAGAVV